MSTQYDTPKDAAEDEREAFASHPSPVLQEVARRDTSSAVAFAGHPIHAMMVHFPIALVFVTLGIDLAYWWTGESFWVEAGLWSAGAAFAFGVAAALVGTVELLLVAGIRLRVASWNHAVAAMTLLAAASANWGLRATVPEAVLPHGLGLSVLSSIITGFAGWHGGKLIFDHGIGLVISERD